MKIVVLFLCPVIPAGKSCLIRHLFVESTSSVFVLLESMFGVKGDLEGICFIFPFLEVPNGCSRIKSGSLHKKKIDAKSTSLGSLFWTECLCSSNHTELKKHQRCCCNPVNVSYKRYLPTGNHHITHSSDLCKIRGCGNGRHKKSDDIGFWVNMTNPQSKQQQRGQSEKDLHDPCNFVSKLVAEPLMLAALNHFLPLLDWTS